MAAVSNYGEFLRRQFRRSVCRCFDYCLKYKLDNKRYKQTFRVDQLDGPLVFQDMYWDARRPSLKFETWRDAWKYLQRKGIWEWIPAYEVKCSISENLFRREYGRRFEMLDSDIENANLF